MKNKYFQIAIFVLVLVVVLFLSGGLYVVDETKQVVITQFGKPVGSSVTAAGLHFKVPFIQRGRYFEKRLLEWDGDPNQIPTRDKRYIWVDTTARWKINDALLFLQSVGGEIGAQARLDDIINSATRDIITSEKLVESIRNSDRILNTEVEISTLSLAEEALESIQYGRETLENLILKKARVIAPQYGIDLVDVRIKRINYVEEVRRKVYDRMISERKRAAEQYRSEGRGKSAEIVGEMEKELKIITSEAYKEAQKLRGAADAEAIKIYAEAYSNDPEFYAFFKTLETYHNSIDSSTVLVLTTDSDYYKYMKEVR